MKRSFVEWLVVFIMALLLAACDGEVQVGMKAGPLAISVNREGVISLEVTSEDFTTIPTPLGSFGPFISYSTDFPTRGVAFVDPSGRFPDQTILVIQTPQQQWIYDLHGADFDIELRQVDGTLRKRGDDIYVEIRQGYLDYSTPPHIITPPQQTAPVLPVQAPETHGATSDCNLQLGQRVSVTQDARLWNQPDVGEEDNKAYYQSLPAGEQFYILAGPAWGRIRWDTQAEGWWWEVSKTSGGESFGWLWEERIDECS